MSKTYNLGNGRNLRRFVRIVLLLFLLLFILLNILAFRQSRSFFYYSEGLERTPSPEELNWQQKIGIVFKGVHIPKPKGYTSPGDWNLAFEDISVPGREGYLLSGWFIPARDQADVVLVFHGYNTEKSGLLPEASMFHKLGYNVVMVDFPGSGESPGNGVSLGIHEARDVERVLDWSRAKWPNRKVILYGHSMGGAAVMRAIAELDVKPDAAIVESVFDTMLGAIRHRIERVNAPSFLVAEIFLFWSSIQIGANGFSHDIVSYAEKIDVPVLISHGAKDIRAPIDGARRVHQALMDPPDFLMIRDAGHVSPYLSDEEKWIGVVQSFLQDYLDL